MVKLMARGTMQDAGAHQEVHGAEQGGKEERAAHVQVHE